MSRIDAVDIHVFNFDVPNLGLESEQEVAVPNIGDKPSSKITRRNTWSSAGPPTAALSITADGGLDSKEAFAGFAERRLQLGYGACKIHGRHDGHARDDALRACCGRTDPAATWLISYYGHNSTRTLP